jgi:hypothetical protein
MLRFRLFASIALLSLAGALNAQVEVGQYPFGTYSTTGPDVVNLGNLSVLWSVPILNKAGRGIPLTYSLTYNSSIWYPVTSGSSTTWQPVSGWGWSGLSPAGNAEITYQETHSTAQCSNGTRNRTTYYEWTFYGLQYVDLVGTRDPRKGAVEELKAPLREPQWNEQPTASYRENTGVYGLLWVNMLGISG